MYVCVCVYIGLIGRAKRAPTLGCSIEISRDIYVGMSVCLSYVKLTA